MWILRSVRARPSWSDTFFFKSPIESGEANSENKNNANAGDTVNPKCFIITTFCELRIERLCLLIGSQNCAPVSIYYAKWWP